jgi:hypothetical protein
MKLISFYQFHNLRKEENYIILNNIWIFILFFIHNINLLCWRMFMMKSKIYFVLKAVFQKHWIINILSHSLHKRESYHDWNSSSRCRWNHVEKKYYNSFHQWSASLFSIFSGEHFIALNNLAKSHLNLINSRWNKYYKYHKYFKNIKFFHLNVNIHH